MVLSDLGARSAPYNECSCAPVNGIFDNPLNDCFVKRNLPDGTERLYPEERRITMTVSTTESHRSNEYEMSCGYLMRPVRDAREWDEYFNEVRQPHLMQAHAYGEAKRHAEYWCLNRYVFERLGAPVAICQVLEKRLAGIRIVSRINRGPLFLEASPSPEAKVSVLHLVRDHWRIFQGGPLLIAPALEMSEENRKILVQLGFKEWKSYCHCSSLIDLRLEESEIKKRLAPTWRTCLNSSIRSGLALRSSNTAESIEWMLDRHVENMRSKNFQGPKTRFVKALYESRPADIIVMQALFNNEPVAGMLFVRCGQKAEYYIGWFGDLGRKLKSGNFLYWNAVVEMKKAGCRWLDLGGYSSAEKYGRFKQGMRGTEYKLIGEWLCY